MRLDGPEKKLLFKYAQTLRNRTPPILFIPNFNKISLNSNPKIGTQATEENIRKAKDKKLYQAPYGDGYASDTFKDQGNALYDKLICLTEQEQLKLIKTKGKN